MSWLTRLRYLVRRRTRLVRIHAPGGSVETFEGILVGFAHGHYRLRASSAYIEETGDRRPLDGESWIPRERVLYVQVLG